MITILDKLTGFEVFLIIIVIVFGATAVLTSVTAAVGNRHTPRPQPPSGRDGEDGGEGTAPGGDPA